MTSEDKIRTVAVKRFVEHDRGALVAYGDFGSFFQAWSEHAARWEIPHDGLATIMMQQGLAAATLHVSCLPLDETMGMTINIKNPAINLFLTGNVKIGSVAGRAFLDSVQSAETSRLFVQTVRSEGSHESSIDVTGLDVLDIFEQYYEKSIQAPCKFYELKESNHYCMIQGLPELDLEWHKNLDREAASVLVNAEHNLLDRREFSFFCGCNPERIIAALIGMFGEDPAELFQGEEGIEANCPRCGTRWWIDRSDFDKGVKAAD